MVKEDKQIKDINQKAEDDINFEEMSKVERYRAYYEMLETNYNLAKYHLLNDSEYHSFHNYFKLVDEKAKVDFLNEIETYFPNLKNVKPSAYYQKSDKKVGIICDEFLYNSFKDVSNLVYISHNDIDRLSEIDIDYFMYATSWRGIDMTWEGSASPSNDLRQDIYKVIHHFKERGIKTVFYSKEDPVNYNLFKDISILCDVVFTSAMEMVPTYVELCGHVNVHSLQFGINPNYHNPVGTRSNYASDVKNDVIFAGSWLTKYPTRNKETSMILDGLINAEKDFTIIDRNLNLKKDRYLFPVKYIPYLTYPMNHEDLMNTHKLYRWAINLNSVKYSETMFANRIFELQAFGILLLSNYSVGVNNQFPNVFMINNHSDVAPIVNNYSERDLREFQGKAIRNVFREHTTYHRFSYIENIVLDSPMMKEQNKILVVNQDESDKVRENFERQMYVDATLINKSELNSTNLKEYDYITFMSKQNIYGEYYLEDLLTPFKYVDVDFVTKNGTGEVHNLTGHFKDINTTMFKVNAIDGIEELNTLSNGYLADDIELENNYRAPKSSKKLSVIVPIHNNGVYLEDKCFASLRRSSIFDQMEIVFVNDGSTDDETIKIINRIRRKYPNHILYKEFDEGSGSASRPRNIGVEIATSPYITYLDPDNEAMGDGYGKLFDRLMSDDSLDLVVGNIMKEDNVRRSNFNFAQTIKKYNHNSLLIEDTHQFMKDSGLRAQSIQALIVKKSIILDNNIKMVEGAAGQDTMFFQELMLYSKNVAAINAYIHMYYAAVSGSVTNTIGAKFFDKYYKLETERIPFLKKHKLLDAYMTERFNFYVKGWYMVRFDRIKPEERHEAITRFLDIYSLYDGIKRPQDIELNQTIEQLKREVNYKE
ncbi:glycosyltransferase [Macrococcoides canis]|uniref:glycosyltransferase n=1 Tax=Macrococcoides canis TaxID=1855823 RepID=UPI001FB6D2FF|nr:glycosyltransferase [Macrococcus canis]